MGLILGFFSLMTTALAVGCISLALRRGQEGDALQAVSYGFLALAFALFAAHLWPSLLGMLGGRTQLELGEKQLAIRRSLFGIVRRSSSLAIPLTEGTRFRLMCWEQLPLTLNNRIPLNSLLADDAGANPHKQTTYAVCVCSPLQEHRLQDFHSRTEALALLQSLHAAYPHIPAEVNNHPLDW